MTNHLSSIFSDKMASRDGMKESGRYFCKLILITHTSKTKNHITQFLWFSCVCVCFLPDFFNTTMTMLTMWEDNLQCKSIDNCTHTYTFDASTPMPSILCKPCECQQHLNVPHGVGAMSDTNRTEQNMQASQPAWLSRPHSQQSKLIEYCSHCVSTISQTFKLVFDR